MAGKKLNSNQKKAIEHGNGPFLIIAGAGMAAHLAGSIAGKTTLPVIGVPIDASPLQGIDSLLSTVQMPPGVPVAGMSIGGAKNAGLFAVQILALSDNKLNEALVDYKVTMEEKVRHLSETTAIYNSGNCHEAE